MFWGIFHGNFIIIERLGWSKILKKMPSFFGWIYTLFVVIIGWVYFRIESFEEANKFVVLMFNFSTNNPYSFSYFLTNERIAIIGLAILACTSLPEILVSYCKSIKFLNYFKFIKPILLLGLFLYSIMIINSGSYNPFIYFRF